MKNIRKIFGVDNRNADEGMSPADKATQDILNMSQQEHEEMMMRVIRKASEDQLKILRSK